MRFAIPPHVFTLNDSSLLRTDFSRGFLERSEKKAQLHQKEIVLMKLFSST
jgi:hypothetical protein